MINCAYQRRERKKMRGTVVGRKEGRKDITDLKRLNSKDKSAVENLFQKTHN